MTSFNFNFNCFKHVKKCFCFCNSKGKNDKKELEPEMTYEIAKKEQHFYIKPLEVINKEDLFEHLHNITISIISNMKGDILSLSKTDYDNSKMIDTSKIKMKDLKNIFPRKMSMLINSLYDKVRESKEEKGCLLEFENYQYQLIGIPIIEDNKPLFIIIIKSIYFEEFFK